MSNQKRTVLYIGVTSNLIKRVYEHKEELVDGFTKDYRVHDLIYYEVLEDPDTAFKREKQLKGWTRKKKLGLIASKNPTLIDLYSSIL